MENTNLPAVFKSQAIEVLPNSDRYKCSVKIRSESSNQIYMVSFDTAISAWVCSCRGCVSRGSCKHLESLGVKGRKFGRSELEFHEK